MRSREEKLITCDNPAEILRADSEGQFIAGLLPTTPRHLAFSFRRDTLGVASHFVSAADAAQLNGMTVSQSIRHVFADHELDQDDVDQIGPLRKKYQLDAAMTDEYITPRFFTNLRPLPSFVRDKRKH